LDLNVGCPNPPDKTLSAKALSSLSSILKYRIGTCPMENGFVAAQLCPLDLGLECGDPRLAFGNRQRVEILPSKERNRIAGARGRCDVVSIH